MIEVKGKYTNAKIMIDEIDLTTMNQIVSMVNNESFTNPIAIMPDCHAGKGSTIGFTMEINDRIIPNVVSVDIGCGMRYALLSKTIFNKKSKEFIEREIRRHVPFGMNVHDIQYFDVDEVFDWTELNKKLYFFTTAFNERYETQFHSERFSREKLEETCKRVGVSYDRVVKSIGTVGGGNHFVEVGRDEKGNYAVTVHSGSRNFGKCVAEYWQSVAEKHVHKPSVSIEQHIDWVKKNFPKNKWNEKIKKYDSYYGKKRGFSGLEYLEYEDMYNYMVDMMLAQEYAKVNRKAILDTILSVMDCAAPEEEIECIHNFISFDDWIVRKGAISSHEGELQILPFNMRDGLLICEGKGNAEWNYSAPHGAGRVLSRSKAKATLNKEVEESSMKGIYTTCVPLDEAPSAYKNSKVIEEAIEPTCKILKRIKPVMNIKANE